MVETAEGEGTANDPTVIAVDGPEPNAEQAAAQAAAAAAVERVRAQAMLEGARLKVEKQQAHLDAALLAVSDAEAAIAALEE